MRLTPIATPQITGPRNSGGVSFRSVLARGPQGLPGPGAAAWPADTAVTTDAVYQAPDGSWIKSLGNRTTRASFDATEQTFWVAVLGKAGTVEAVALSAAIDLQAVGRITSTEHAPALGLFFPEAEGAVGDGTTNDTAAIAAAIDACTAAGGGRVVLRPDKTYSVEYVKLKTGVTIDGVHCSRSVARFEHRDNATEHLISLFDGNVSDTGIVNMGLNGRVASQTNAVDGIHLDNTAGGATMLPKHVVKNVHIRSVKGDGLVMGANTRASLVDGFTIYAADGYGVRLKSADSIVTNGDVAQSGLSGVYINGGASYLLSTIKSWFSGRIDGVGNGFWIGGNANLATGLYSQENKGNGFHFFRSGVTLTGNNFTGCTSDADNTAASTYDGFNVFNMTNSTIVGTVCNNASAGVTGNALTIAGGSSGNDITLTTSGLSSWAVEGADQGLNAIRVNGREGRVQTITWTSTQSLGSPYDARTKAVTLAGNTTISNPGRKPAGMQLRLVMKQDGTGGRTVTFSSDFKVSSAWVPVTTANLTNIIDFQSDGTNWLQTGQTLGLA